MRNDTAKEISNTANALKLCNVHDIHTNCEKVMVRKFMATFELFSRESSTTTDQDINDLFMATFMKCFSAGHQHPH